ncbi:MAG TPA: helix-turn-helix domain-containing protein [Stellaceae bacterium]
MSELGKELIKGMRNAIAHVEGKKRASHVTTVEVTIPETIDIAAIRRRLGLTQAGFAARFGFSVKNIQNWEQGVRQPEGSARAYLLVIARDPKAVERALASAA